MAILAEYMVRKEEGESLDSFLNGKVFAASSVKSVDPDPQEVEGFRKYIEKYTELLPAEKLAAEVLN